MFNENTAWEAARKDVRYTVSTLEAVGIHEKQAVAAKELLASWDTIEASRLAAEDELVAGNALVALVDAQLDDLVALLAQKLRGELGRDDSPEFRRFFPEPPSEVIRLGLESELARVKRFAVVAGEIPPPEAAAPVLAAIQEMSARGQQALTRREEATTQRARVSLRIQTWKEQANAVRRSIANQLEAHAIAKKLPPGYADRFFPAVLRSQKKPAPPPAV
jgi:hypothetical protein